MRTYLKTPLGSKSASGILARRSADIIAKAVLLTRQLSLEIQQQKSASFNVTTAVFVANLNERIHISDTYRVGAKLQKF